jgi:nucleotide-binding universal stress UspA family protein
MAEPTSPFTLLAAVDYSDASIVAVDEALRQASLHPRARVVALLVLPGEQPFDAEGAPAAQSYIERARQNLVDLLEARHARVHGAKARPAFEGRVTFGDPGEAIVREGEALHAGLIVVGTHGRRGFERLLLGSVALDVARGAHCTVMIARAEPVETQSTGSEHFEPEAQPEGEYPSTALATGQIVTEPHIDAGRVVVHVLDEPSGRVFLAVFQGFGRVTIEPIEGEHSTPPSAEERSRAAETALAYSREEQSLFEELFEELARRNSKPE